MTSREAILAAVRASLPKGEYPLPDLPIFPTADGGDRMALFVRQLGSMGGEGVVGECVGGFMAKRFPDAKVVASAVAEYTGNRDLSQMTRPGDLEDVDVAIVRAAMGVAETGSVLLTDDALKVNAVAYLAQHLVVLLDVSCIVPSLQEAYRSAELAMHRYACFHSGPSATADIEGVLIRGAQGVRSLTVLLQASHPAGGRGASVLRSG